MVERFTQSVILAFQLTPANPSRNLWVVEDRLKVETPRLPVLNACFHLDQVNAPDHLVHGAEAQLRHPFANLLAIKKKKLTTCSGDPANFLRNSGFCVAMPTGQVFR